ncbi:MAG: class I SAM-dependent methyltransferase [Candidatus Dormibacteraeota bacterium]|nr:class I SAM-dependent methyltransferase [Candidatus Dormibacteraeota bacterium]
MSEPTPLRARELDQHDGCRIVNPVVERPYSDGSEERIFDIVRQAGDITSLSDELALAGLEWPDRYHLSHARANVVRGLDLVSDMRVLEVGAGCGAITRLLGERCSVVDAVEPEFPRARVARSRTRDLASVEVFVGGLNDVPPVPAYDAVFVVGVLEYSGGGAVDDSPYLDFLQRVHSVLRPGGSAVIAIENRLGVKYIAGAPEDHTGNAYEGVEGYRRRSHALTFSRRALCSLVRSAGMSPSVLSAFPDYKFTRALIHDDLLTRHPSLAWRIPMYATGGIAAGDDAVDERLLWRQVVEAGVATEFANSFVVLAEKGEGGRQLWPDGALAAVFQPGRRAAYTVRTVVSHRAGDTRFEREKLQPDGDTGQLRHHPRSEDLVDGVDMLELLEQDAGTLDAALLRSWRAMVAEHDASAPSLDLVPANLVQARDGSLHQIDDEWTHDSYSSGAVLARGALTTGLHLAANTHPSRWDERTVRDLVRRIGSVVIPDAPQRWIEDTVDREADLQAAVFLPPPGLSAGMTSAQAHRSRFREWLSREMRSMPLGRRAVDRAALAEQHATLLATERDSLRQQLDAMSSSRSWRITAPLRATSRQLRRR